MSQPFTEIIGHSRAELQAALSLAEARLSNGQTVRLDLITTRMPTALQLETMHAHMIAEGHHVSKPIAFMQEGFSVVEFKATKGSPILLALIPLIPTVIIGALVAFGLTKIESISKALLPLLLVTVGGVVILATVVTRKAPMEAASRYLPAPRR